MRAACALKAYWIASTIQYTICNIVCTYIAYIISYTTYACLGIFVFLEMKTKSESTNMHSQRELQQCILICLLGGEGVSIEGRRGEECCLHRE